MIFELKKKKNVMAKPKNTELYYNKCGNIPPKIIIQQIRRKTIDVGLVMFNL